jgi:hypothetical protein
MPYMREELNMTRRNVREATSKGGKLDLKEVMDRVDRVLASIPVERLKEFIKQMARAPSRKYPRIQFG